MQRLIPAAALLAVLLSAGAAAGDTGAIPIGGWLVTEAYDGEGVTRPTAILSSPGGASLVAACGAGGLDLFVSFLQPPGGQALHVKWRLDGGAAHDQTWAQAVDPSSFSAGPPAAAHALLRQLAVAHSLTLTADGHREVFDLAGARQVAALIGACAPAAKPSAGS